MVRKKAVTIDVPEEEPEPEPVDIVDEFLDPPYTSVLNSTAAGDGCVSAS